MGGGRGEGRLGRGLGRLGPAPTSSPRPAPLRGVLRVKRRAGRAGLHLRCTKAERGRDGAGGLAGAQNWPRVLSARRSKPHLDPNPAWDPDSDPARPGPRPRPPGRWTTPTSIRTTRAWRPWRRPPTATSAPAASPAASSTVPCDPPSPRPGLPAPRSAPPTARLALYGTISLRLTRQVSPAPVQPSLQILRHPQPLPTRQVVATVPYSRHNLCPSQILQLPAGPTASGVRRGSLGRVEPHPLILPVPLSRCCIPIPCSSGQGNK